MSWVSVLRRIALAEGTSFLALLGVAMPLKYMAGLPQAVLLVGWIHGLLFMLFGVALLAAMFSRCWSFGRTALVFGSALVPFGPFLLDKRIRQWEMEP